MQKYTVAGSIKGFLIICQLKTKKILVWVSYLWFVSRPPKSGCFFEKFTVELVLKSLSGRNKSLKAPVFEFLIVFHMIWKNQESRELWLDGCWGNRHSKIPNSSAKNLFFVFLRCHYGFTNCFEILDLVFPNIPSRVSTCKIITF